MNATHRDAAAADRIVAAIAGSLGSVSKQDIIDRSLDHFRRADPEYGGRMEAAIRDLRQ